MSTHDEQLIKLQNEIERLSKLDTLAYELERDLIAKQFNIRVATLDEYVAKNQIQDEEKEKNILFPNIIPWNEQVNASELLNELEAILHRLMVFPSQHEGKVIALYILHTHCIDAFDCSPILNISSPEKRCGKSTLLSILKRLIYRALLASSISPAAVYRSIEKWQPCLMIDEADAFLRDNEELRGVIDSGHTRDSAYVIRCEGDNHEPVRFNTFCAKIIAGIGHLPETIEDRSIIIQLRRKLNNEKKERLRDVLEQEFINIFKKCARFAKDSINNLKQSRPFIPEELNDRAADNWRPLLAIAELADENWIKSAKAAALHLSDSKQESKSIGVELLEDIQIIFETNKIDRISTEDLLNALGQDNEAPWATFNKGKLMTARQLSNRLKEFKIVSGTIRLSFDMTKKGYYLKSFEDAFQRYIPSSPSSPLFPSVTTTQSNSSAGSVTFSHPSQNQNVTDKKALEPLGDASCNPVTNKMQILEGVREDNNECEVF